MPRTCKNSVDGFCYISGEITLKIQRNWSGQRSLSVLFWKSMLYQLLKNVERLACSKWLLFLHDIKTKILEKNVFELRICKTTKSSTKTLHLQYLQKMTRRWMIQIFLVSRLNRVSFLDVLPHLRTLHLDLQVHQKNFTFLSIPIWMILFEI